MQNSQKISFFFLLAFSAFQAIGAQEKLYQKVELLFNNGTIEQFLDSIQHQTGAVFVYSDVINPHTTVSVQMGSYTTKQLLDSLFAGQSLMYVARNDLIILSPQTRKSIANERIIISGQVKARRDLPVPFATIYIENKSLGTIANAEGVFRFILPSNLVSDSLTISSVGFESVKIPPDNYLTKHLTVQLKTANIPIRSVIVRPENPECLVMQSYDSRKDNYSNSPVLMEAFFREASKQDDDYIALSEALIEISKSKYTSSASDLIRLIKGRNGTNITESELVNLVVEGGLYNGLRLDVAKYGSYFYGEEALEECDFKMLKSILFHNRQTYIIGFDSKEKIDYAGYCGKLYIDIESLALVRAEFELSDEGIKYARNTLIKKTPRGYKAKPVYAKYEVEYRHYNNVWNLHYARSDFGIKVRKARGRKNKGFSCNFTSTSEFVITGVSDNNKNKIRFSEASKSNDVLVRQVEKTNSTFWLEDNIILPEEPLLSTIRKLQQEGALPKDESMMTKDNNVE